MEHHTERQHFVPHFYLNFFSNDKEQVFVLNLEKRKIYIQNTRDLCVENDLYETKWDNNVDSLGKYVLDNQVEQILGNLENRVCTILKNVNSELNRGIANIYLEDKRDVLIEYVAMQYLRNPYVMRQTEHFYEGAENEPAVKEIANTVNAMFKQMNWGSAKPLIKHSVVMGTFNRELDGSPLNVICKNISKMKMVFWHGDRSFVTSDFPLLIDGKETDADRIVLPIGVNNAIVLFNPSFPFLNEGSVYNITPPIVDQLNREYITKYKDGVVRYIISNDRDTLEELKNLSENENARSQ